MEVNVKVDLDKIIENLDGKYLYDLLVPFSDDDIFDAVERLDEYSGDWQILERAVKYVQRMKKELALEIEDGYNGRHISKETYEFLKKD